MLVALNGTFDSAGICQASCLNNPDESWRMSNGVYCGHKTLSQKVLLERWLTTPQKQPYTCLTCIRPLLQELPVKTDWKSSLTDRHGTLAVVSPASTGNKSQSLHTNAATSTAVNNPGEWKTTRPLNYGPDQKKAAGGWFYFY